MMSTVEHICGVDPFSLSVSETHRLARELRRAGTAPEARVAFGGNIVFEPLPEYLEAHLACKGIAAATYSGGFNQHLQEIIDPTSALHRFDPNFLFLHTELDAVLPGLVDRHDGTAEHWRRGMTEMLSLIESVVNEALEKTHASVLLTNFVAPDRYDFGLADWRCELGEQEFSWQLNSALNRRFRTEPRVQIVDLCRLMALHGHERARDRRLYYLAKVPWHESFLPILANELTRHVSVSLGRIHKCLVVDLDNTLWHGVLGEEGPWGVRVGTGDSIAEAHLDLQRRILAIKRRGVLIAVCSKNNREDVEQMFSLHPEMPLRLDDFVCLELGWEMKHEGLQRIAANLNIGTDSLVFLDDNPTEIELIRQMMPEVECILVPEDPVLRPMCLDRFHGLERTVITSEDLAKTRQYKENEVRHSARSGFADLQEYLYSLRTHVEIRAATPELLARAQQLFAKTNQFNLTSQRYTLAQLHEVEVDETSAILLIRAADRFGELGWIGAVVLQDLDRPTARIDNFVLSCRAMGRGIESAILNHIKQLCFTQSSCRILQTQYLPTAKNAPVRELYEQHGFLAIETDTRGAKLYQLSREDLAFTPCDWIEVKNGDTNDLGHETPR